MAINFSISEYLEKLANKVNQDSSNPCGVLRTQIPLPAIDPLEFLATVSFPAKLFFASRDTGFECAGIGSCLDLFDFHPSEYQSVFKRMVANNSRSLRFYGGFRFDQLAARGGCWEDFPVFRFVLPRLEILREDQEFTLALNLTRPELPRAPQIISDLIRCLEHKLPRPTIELTDLESGKESWAKSFSRAQQSLLAGTIDKLVVARKSTFTLNQSIDPAYLLYLIRERNPNCYYFLIQDPLGQSSFIGATPEKLYSRDRAKITTEAIAGTRPRGKDFYEDEQLAQELLESEKEMREHDYVTTRISECLVPICSHLSEDAKASILKLTNVQHLVTRFAGELSPKRLSDADIIAGLHPTPAVAGHPGDRAKHLIREIERFDRGWYAGPLGWFGGDSSEFCVAIRSAVLKENFLTTFVGSGIVSGATIEEEDREIDAKLRVFSTLFDDPKGGQINRSPTHQPTMVQGINN